ncbi:glycosyltransferase involved in cell wall biosynthesis [Microbacterium testaceum]|uniref:glycosyltransferase family 4 protein n=1 Tax=Microbacterium testaceum TaxID=2033 RepID=UPI0027855B77|nr:glycosyltransferase family 1 protein [Microbacterium testaceum]MDQ1173109.1 glycosyltransferase involved in cell wall biosynthesis [Microbacterium testaceum]
MPRVLVDLLSYSGTKGGMETYTRDLYRALGELDDDYEYIGYLSREGATLDRSWFPGRIIESGISGENRFQWAWGELTQVARAARAEGVDLVHAPATLGPRRTAMPTVVTMHDMLYWSHPEYMSTPLYTAPVKWMEKVAARNAARIVTISPTSADEIVRFLGVPRDTLDVVPLAGSSPTGVDRSRAGEAGPFILAMGNRRPHKNWGALIRAIALIPAERRPRVIITGGRGDDPLRAEVDATGMHDWVQLRGWVDDAEVVELYSTATALAIPSLAEGFSLPTLEAMGAGVPVLLSDIDVHRFVGGPAARYFDARDDSAVAAAIDEVCSDADLRQRLSVDGLARAAEFTWERTARETRASFDAALGLTR